MTNSRSRRSLLSGAAGLFVLAAGCLADETESDDSDGEDPDESPNGTDEEPESEPEPETQAFRHSEAASNPNAALFLERADAEEWFADRAVDDESVTTFVEETSFEESSLVALEAGGPDLCYELVLESVDVREGRLEIEAAVVDESDEDESCAQQVTTVGQLVRASDDGAPVTEASGTIVDHDDATHEFDIDAGNESKSEGDSDGDSDDNDEPSDPNSTNESDDE